MAVPTRGARLYTAMLIARFPLEVPPLDKTMGLAPEKKHLLNNLSVVPATERSLQQKESGSKAAWYKSLPSGDAVESSNSDLASK